MTTRTTVETPHTCGYCHGIHDPAAGVRVAPSPDAPDGDPLAAFTEDEVMYDYPVAQSGEPMDPVLFIEWDAIHRHGYRLSRSLGVAPSPDPLGTPCPRCGRYDSHDHDAAPSPDAEPCRDCSCHYVRVAPSPDAPGPDHDGHTPHDPPAYLYDAAQTVVSTYSGTGAPTDATIRARAIAVAHLAAVLHDMERPSPDAPGHDAGYTLDTEALYRENEAALRAPTEGERMSATMTSIAFDEQFDIEGTVYTVTRGDDGVPVLTVVGELFDLADEPEPTDG